MKEDEKAFWNTFLNQKVGNITEEYDFLLDEPFGSLYQSVLAAFLAWVRPDWSLFSLLKAPVESVVRTLYSGIRDIPMRVCIYDMGLQKQNGRLEGKNDVEEYEYYCRELLGNDTYLKELCRQYPELRRLLFIRMNYALDNLIELLRNLEKDRQEIEKRLCHSEEFRYVVKLECNCSDSHEGGKTVVKCRLDNGHVIIYKPHGLMKELTYQRMHAWFCKKCGLDSLTFGVVDGGCYGWEECLERKPCENAEQVERFFFRMGIHLFLSTLLCGSDMHQENVLAAGEHPVLLDLETFPGIRRKQRIQSADDKISSLLQYAVTGTGILPIPVWKNESASVILGALFKGGQMETSVKLPVIVNGKTSRMAVEYQRIKINAGESLPVYENAVVDPKGYMEELNRGFLDAFWIWQTNRPSVDSLLEPFWVCPVRFLIRHTQQYSMYLSTSLHPVFLKEKKTRLEMLQVLRKANEDEALVKQEIEAMMQMDIPLFQCGSKEITPYFKTSAYECYGEQVTRFTEQYMQRQLVLIQLSMEMLPSIKATASTEALYLSGRLNAYKKMEQQESGGSAGLNTESCQTEQKSHTALGKILQKVMEQAVTEQNDVGWVSLYSEDNGYWRLRPAGIDLYDGIGGIAVFLCCMMNKGLLKDKALYELAVRKLFRCTDEGTNKNREKTGLMIGGGSVAYTFLLLYRMTGAERFWKYAVKQASELEQFYLQDRHFDLLSGNAGAILVLTEMYRQSGEERWLLLAVRIGEWLWEKAEKQSVGYGWKTGSGGEALAGMSHGNSGFIFAYASLLEYTREQKYAEIIDQLLMYENSLYSEQYGNWRDKRYPEQEVYSNAWCHGAPGILLARLKLLELPEYEKNPAVHADIARASVALFLRSERDGLCLCHGMAGNYRIMKEYEKRCGLNEEQKRVMERMKERIVDCVLDWDVMLPQEKYVPGLMTGLAGIGCVLGGI